MLRCGNVDDAKMEGWKDGSLHRARGSLLFTRVCGCGGSLAAGRQTPEPEEEAFTSVGGSCPHIV